MRLLNLPLPIFAAVLAPQVEPPGAAQAPAWMAAFFAGIFTLGWFLEKWGKLPGTSGDRRAPGFGDADRTHLDQVHEVVTREDTEKPGWRMVWNPSRETREIRDLLRELTELKAVWQEERADWKRERARMEERITFLEDALRRQEHAREGMR